MTPAKPKGPSLNPFSEFSERYGPYAFGVASLLIIWFTIVGPELVRSRADYEEFSRGAMVLRDASSALKATAGVLEKTTTRLEIIAQRIDNQRKDP